MADHQFPVDGILDVFKLWVRIRQVALCAVLNVKHDFFGALYTHSE